MKKILGLFVLLYVGHLTSFAQQANVRTSYKPNLVVAKDGSGDYTTIQEAVDAVRAYTPVHVTIRIKNGWYHEKVTIPSWVTNLSIIGESIEARCTACLYGEYSYCIEDIDAVFGVDK